MREQPHTFEYCGSYPPLECKLSLDSFHAVYQVYVERMQTVAILINKIMLWPLETSKLRENDSVCQECQQHVE